MGYMKDILIEMEETGKTYSEAVFEKMLKILYSKNQYSLRDFISECATVLDCRKVKNFDSLSFDKKEEFIKERSKSAKSPNKELVELVCSAEKEITLLDIYFIVSDFFAKNDLKDDNLNLKDLFKNENNILLTSVEMYIKVIPDLLKDENGSVTRKNITIWVFDDMLYMILKNDYKDYANITIKYNDLYYSNDETKFSTILCIPEFMHQRGNFMKDDFECKDLGVYGLNKLFKQNLDKDGKLFIVLSNKVNYSESEKTFRNEYKKHLVSVKNLPNNTFKFSRIKTYLYEFRKTEYNGPIMLTGFGSSAPNDSIAKKFDEILTNDRWDFEKPFSNYSDINSLKCSNSDSLDNLAVVKRGNAVSTRAKEVDKNEDFLFIDLRDLDDDEINYTKAKKYRCENDLSKHYLKYGDILIPNKGKTTKIVIHNKKDCNCIASSNIIVVRVNSNIEPEFLVMYLKSLVGQNVLKSICRTTVMSMINHEDIKGIPVPVFDSKKRKMLLAEYSKVKEKYQKISDMNKEIEKMEKDLSDKLCSIIK